MTRLCPLFGEGELGPHLTQSPGPRSTSIPSGILVHPAISPQATWAENWGALSLWGRGAGSLSNTTSPNAKFHLDPSSRLATVHQRHRQTGPVRQRSDRANRFANVAQRPFCILMKQEMMGVAVASVRTLCKLHLAPDR